VLTLQDLRLWLLWLPPAFIAGYLKMVVLLQSGVCYQCTALNGQSWLDKAGELSFFRADLLVMVVAVPALLSVLARLFPGRRALPIAAAAVSASLYLYLFAQVQCVVTVGSFVAPDLLLDGLAWAAHAPEAGSAYMPGSAVVFIVVGLAIIAAALHRNPRVRPSGSSPSRALNALPRLVALAAGLLTLVAWIWPVPTSALHKSAIAQALWPSSGWSPAVSSNLSSMTAQSLWQEYRRVYNAPQSSREPRYWASMAGADVFVFVFETGPAKCLPIDGDLSDFPTLARLRQRAFIAPRHYTTAPITKLAIVSIFNSLYPPGSGSREFEQPGIPVLPGVPRALADAGYVTEYASGASLETYLGFKRQLASQGFQRIRGPEEPRGQFDQEPEVPWAERQRRLDDGALGLLRRDLHRLSSNGQRYLAAFCPLFGHAPWSDIFNGKHHEIYQLGRAYMALQDRWLGELVADLEKSGRLDRTIIVVTADHGIRTRKEDPGFPVGLTDAVSFHVPLLIWAPGAVDTATTIPYPTSHLDIGPTVLDLLGVETGREFEQGAPLWDPRIKRRETFYLGKFLTGSDGFHRDGGFYMYQYLTDSLRESADMHFDLRVPPLPASTRRTELLRDLTHFTEIQRALIRGITTGPR